jgi:hypothetical protein
MESLMHFKNTILTGFHAGRCLPLVRVVAIGLAGWLACGVIAGCGRRAAVKSTPPEPDPLARVGGVAITLGDYDFEVQRRITSGRPVGEPRAVVQELVERQAMLQEAARAPWMNEPEARRERENQMLAQWLERTLLAEKKRVSVSDEELRARFRERTADFTRPAMVRLAILYRRVSPRDQRDKNDDTASALKQAREEFLRDRSAATQSGRIPGFGTVAAKASEDTVSRYRGGDLGWMEAGSKEFRQPAAVVEAGCVLPAGGVSDVLRTEQGLYVVMKQDERGSKTMSFEEAAPALRRQLLRQKEDAVERDFRGNLLARIAVSVDTGRVARLTVPNGAPGSHPSAPGPLAKALPVP